MKTKLNQHKRLLWKFWLQPTRCWMAVAISMLLPLLNSQAGPVVQLLWSVQPGSASAGVPFGQQPTLITADAQGNPSTEGLASSVNVTVDTVPPGGLAGGARNVDIGTAANNGTVVFNDLQIDSTGGYSLMAAAGNGTNGVFSPTNGMSSCKLWLDASDTNTLTVGTNNLTFWGDKSGTGNNATNIANTPSTNIDVNLAPFAAGGQRVVSFSNTWLNIDLNSITNSAYTIIALTELDPTVTANNDYYIGSQYFGSGVDQVLHIGWSNPTTYHWGQYADDLNVTAPAGPVIASHVHGVGNKQIYFNGVLAGENVSGQNNLGSIGQAEVGRGNYGPFHGDIAELIVYRTNLTTLQRVGVENYLANKWLGQFSAARASTTFFVGNSEGVPAGIGITQQPTDAVAGVNISPGVGVTVTNSSGVGISGLTVFVSLLDGSGTLNGTLSQVTDGSGTVTFNDLNLTVGGQKQLQFIIPGTVTNDSSVFNITPAAPAQLAINTQPSATGVAGIELGTQPVVSVEDAYGNIISDNTDVITVSQAAGGNLSQTGGNSMSVAAVAGTASFTGLYLTNAATSQLTFNDVALTLGTNSTDIVVTPNVPASITVQQQPSITAQIGVVLDTQPGVLVQDAYGNSVSNGTPVVASVGASSVLGDPMELTVDGVATYSSLSVTNLGNITLTFTVGSVTANSDVMNVGAGPATTLVWTTQPGSATAGAPFGQQPVLKTADAAGNPTTAGLPATSWVVVHQVSGSGLVGNSFTYNIGTAGSNGVITFNNLQIDTAGLSNVLSADFIGDDSGTPTNGIPNCILWLDAYASNTLNMTGANLTQWNDKSGTANNGVNTNNYPTTGLNTALPINAYGGQHVVTFSGNSWLNVDLSSLSENFNGFTVFAVEVASAAALSGNNNYYFGSEYNGVDATLHLGYQNHNTFKFAQYADDLTWTAPADFTPATPRLWTARVDSSALRSIFLNGVMKASGNVNLTGVITNGSVGRGNGGYYNGGVAEILVYNRGLSDSERQAVENYLTRKWLSNSRALTQPFTVAGGAATQLVWTTEPGSATVGSPFGQQPVLKTADLAGNPTTAGLPATSWVVVHQISGSGLVGNSFTYNIGTAGSNGVITFNDLQINTPGTNNILSADFIGDASVPTNGIPNCILWLDAYSGNTLTLSGTNLTQWGDKSGIANNAINTNNYPTTNLNPALPYLGYGGQHTVSFLGNNWLNVDLSSLSNDTNGFTVIAVDVANAAAYAGSSYFFGSGFNGVDATLHLGYQGPNTFRFAQYADDLDWTAPANFTPETPRIWTARVDSSASRNIFLNGVLEASGAVNLTGVITNGTIGTGNSGNYNGDLAEILVYDRSLSDAERQVVEQYLNWKWLSDSRALTTPFTVDSISGTTPTLGVVNNGSSGGSGNVMTLNITGTPGAYYRILATSDITLPLASWQVVVGGIIDQTGMWQFNVTNTLPAQFYRVVTP